jgi:hypothetical protein
MTKINEQGNTENAQALASPHERLVNAPIADTLWQRCFWEVADKCKKTGAKTIEFEDVDRVVLEKSKMTIPDFLEWLAR